MIKRITIPAISFTGALAPPLEGGRTTGGAGRVGSGSATGESGGPVTGSASSTGVPQLSQNFTPSDNAVPQTVQNFCPIPHTHPEGY
jgi:hypothetical protein